jgi:hypothetical protein
MVKLFNLTVIEGAAAPAVVNGLPTARGLRLERAIEAAKCLFESIENGSRRAKQGQSVEHEHNIRHGAITRLSDTKARVACKRICAP